jgi:hypothetical protein
MITLLTGNNDIIHKEIEQKVSKNDTDVTAGNVTAAVISDEQGNFFIGFANKDLVVIAAFFRE